MRRWLAIAATAAMAVAAGAQRPVTEVWIALPQPLAERALPIVQGEVGGAAAVRIVAAEGLLAEVAAQPGTRILFGVPEHALQILAHAGRLARSPGLTAGLVPARGRDPGERYVLPWSTAYCLVALPGLPAVGDTLAAVARSGLLQDRLGLCAPEIDCGPWLGALIEECVGPRGLDGGFALWLALDARAGGAYQPSYPALLDALRGGRLTAGLVPVALAADPVAASGLAEVALRNPPVALFGVGVASATPVVPDVAALAAALARIRGGALLLAGHGASRDPGAAPVPPLDFELARSALQRFDAGIRGRGRPVEQLDEWLDLVFGVAFAGFLLLVYRRLRRSEPDAPVGS